MLETWIRSHDYTSSFGLPQTAAQGSQVREVAGHHRMKPLPFRNGLFEKERIHLAQKSSFWPGPGRKNSSWD